jgi:glycosyltransferase involved in cell wall biosynthesis
VPTIIAHEHNWSYTGDRLRVLLDGRVVGRLADRFIAVSNANRRRMVELEGVAADKVLVLPTAYVPHLDGGAADVRVELGIGPEEPVIGVAAGLRPEKALDVMIDAYAHVCARIDRARLVIAGDGPCREDLQRQVRRLGLEGRVHFLGQRRDIDAILSSVDVGAMSSDWEGMPLFALECMAAGLPLVATAVGGLPELVQNGVNGILVAPQDPIALADGLEKLLTDRELAKRLAATAAERLAEFEIDAVAARFADLYAELAGNAA